MESSYEGRVGGKLRRRPFRRPSTPYDRPPAAPANPNGSQRNGLLSKLIDPASRTIYGSAARLLSSVFRNRLPSPATLPEVNLEPRNDLQGESCSSPSSASQEQGDCEIKNQIENSEIKELEQLLKQKTFTRVEFDHLTELLRSRTIDLPKDDEKKITKPSSLQFVATQARDEKITAAQDDRVESSRLFESISTPSSGLLVPEEVTSPAELAKAYMGSRSSKLLPSSLGFRSQLFREDLHLLNTVPFAPKSPNRLHARRPAAGCFSAVPQLSENHWLTPRSFGRSAMYSMARSPYTRSHSKATHKGAGQTDDAHVGSRTSQWTQVNKTLSSGNQILKRTSSVLDSDFGSVGPMRRIRQKSNLMSPSMYAKSSVPGSPTFIRQASVSSDSVWGSMSSMQKPRLLDGPRDTISKTQVAESGDNNHSTTSSAFVRHQSSEVAMKIMEELDKLVPSPKDKPSESKVAVARGNSPSKLNLDVSNGQSSKSKECKGSPRVQNVQINGTLDGLGKAQLPALGNSISGTQDIVEVDGPVKNVDTAITASSADSAKNTVKDTLIDARPVGSVIFSFAANLPQNKRGFQGAVEVTDDSFSGKSVLSPLPPENIQTKSYISENKTVVSEMIKAEQPVPNSPERKRATAANEVADTRSGSVDCSIVPLKDPGSISTITSAADTTKPLPPTPAAESPSSFNTITSPKEEPATPLFSFGSKSTETVPPFSFSSSTHCVKGTSSITSVESNTKILSGFAMKEMNAPEAPGSDKDEQHLKGKDLHNSSENAITGISTLAAQKIFSFGVSANTSLSNGSLTSTFMSSSVSAAPEAPSSGKSARLIFSGNSATMSACSSSNSPITTAAPASKFGCTNFSAATSTNSVSAPTSTSSFISTNSELKTKQASLPFGATGSSIPAATSALAHTGSSVFSFVASMSSSNTTSSLSVSNLPQSSTPFGAATGSFGTASGITSFMGSMQSQFRSSSSSTFGLSVSSPLDFASSPFGSTSSSGSGFSFSASSSTGSSSSGSGASSSFAQASSTAACSFSSSSKSSTSCIFSSGFGSSSAMGFSFGATAATGSTPLTIGSTVGVSSGSLFSPSTIGSSLGNSSGSLFSFTSAATLSSLSPSKPVFGIPKPAVGSGPALPVNDKMHVDDSMAEDTVQASVPLAPAFGQLAGSQLPLNFSFGSTSVPVNGSSVFQFGGHQNTAAPENPSTFPGGSFSLGTGGADKSARRIVKIKRDKHRKKSVP